MEQQVIDIDYYQLERDFDRVKTQVFRSKSGSFLGSLMCSLNFLWVEDINTAQTNGINLYWNPYFYLSLHKHVRPTILLHELWHPGLLHNVRGIGKHPRLWNYAADIVINNMLDDEGWSFEGLTPWLDHQYDGATTEEVYEDLYRRQEEEQENLQDLFDLFQWINPHTGQGDETDILEPEGSEEVREVIERELVNKVVAASHVASLSGDAGELPGEVQQTIEQFLNPKLPWENILYQFFNDLASSDYSWQRPNRRYPDLYLPSMIDDRDGLEHLIYFQDVSGSITDGQMIRFLSEFKYVKELFEPEKMTMVQFDTIIQREDVFEKEDPFEEVQIQGRGGTSLAPVREYILEHKPTAVVIFSDLQCTPMEPLKGPDKIPIIWIAVNNPKAEVPHGTLVHLRE